MKSRFLVALSLLMGYGGILFGQTAKNKAEQIAEEFSKNKVKEKNKNGVKTETRKVVEAVPDIRDNAAGYAGKYELQGFGYSIVLRLLADNNWEGDCFKSEEGQPIKHATLNDIKIESGLLTAIVQHADGRTLPFEAVFINRFENGEKSNGIGIRQVFQLSNGFVTDKAFYTRTE
jgi:hypothetical protein